MPNSTLVEKRNELDAKRKKLHEVFAEAGDDFDMGKVKSLEGDSHQKVDTIRQMDAELNDLASEVETLAEIERIGKEAKGYATADRTVHASGDDESEGKSRQRKSVGQQLMESPAIQQKSGAIGPTSHIDVDLKTLFETTAGWEPESTRTGILVDSAERPIQVTDLFPMNTTGQASVVYMEETTFTNSAQETAEGGTYQEAALALTERTESVRKVAVWIPGTDEQLEDVSGASGYLDRRLRFMLRQRLDLQLLVGNGTAPNLEGILERSNINTQAKSTDPIPDAVYKGMTTARVTGRAQPNAVIFHPNNWQTVRLLRTSDGVYIWGNPSEPGPARIWGLPVVESDAITENTALVGDFANFSELYMRRGVEVQVTNSHGDYFIEGKQAMRADFRAALAVYRPSAFSEITGLDG